MNNTVQNKIQYGVLMVNLGTPELPTVQAVKRYLAAFLSDRRVIDISPILWLPILYSIILPIRSIRIGNLYKSIWLKEGSPLIVWSYLLRKALANSLPDISIEIAMRYGLPTLKQAIYRLLATNIARLVILPLYPQYSSSTTASIWDAVTKILRNYHRIPSISFIRDYADHPAYIMALVASILRSFKKHGKPDKLIISFHSIPIRYIIRGDDYLERCKITQRLLSIALNFPIEKMPLTFQSKYGYSHWLSPNTREVMKLLPSQGVNNIQIICPGFAVDCLETLQEICIQNKKTFIDAGGTFFYYIPALNINIEHIMLLRQLIIKEL